MCLIGHGERRKYLNETVEIVKNKLSYCIIHRIRPVICIGENEVSEKAVDILEKQISELILDLHQEFLCFDIAYEPNFAINSRSPEIAYINQMIDAIHAIKNKYKIQGLGLLRRVCKFGKLC